jgi:hypothetical protein
MGYKYDFEIVTTKEELKPMKVNFKVWHKTSWYKWNDNLIGEESFDLWTVFTSSTKMSKKKWGILRILDSNSERGYIEYSAQCITTGDKIIALRDLEDPDEEEAEAEGGRKEKLQDKIIDALPDEKKKFSLTINIFNGLFTQFRDVAEVSMKLKIIITEKDTHTIEVIN